jgi:hypothetical protein
VPASVCAASSVGGCSTSCERARVRRRRAIPTTVVGRSRRLWEDGDVGSSRVSRRYRPSYTAVGRVPRRRVRFRSRGGPVSAMRRGPGC